MKDAPAFDFYPERWTHGTRHMTKVERCDYIDLLCHQWTDDGLPENVDILARLVGYKSGRQIPVLVLEKFPVSPDGKRRNPELEETRSRFRKTPPARFSVRIDITVYQRRRRTANAYIRRKDVREATFAIHGRQCVKCRSCVDVCLDHVVPVSAGGEDAVSNLQPLCRPCNSAKGGRV